MIKRIIFDIDDTLIKFPKEFEIGYKEVLKKYNLDIEPKVLYKVIGEYETSGKYKYYDVDKLLNLINEKLNIKLGDDFVNDFFSMYNKLITEVDESVIETLKYLKDKYELVTLSNWFTNSQKERLKCVGIDNYFNEIYGTDIVPMKPLRESFLSVLGNNRIDECLIVGDNLNIDIKIPYEMGMNVYHLNNKGTSKYPTIRKVSDLKELL